MTLLMMSGLQRSVRRALLATAAAVLVFPLGTGKTWAHGEGSGALGEVDFAVSCDAEAGEAFESGLTLLHHMMYEQAESIFAGAAVAAPDCAMLDWGVAMSRFHPLWPGQPSTDDIAAGKAAVARLSGAGDVTGAERALIGAVQAFYAADEMPYRERVAAWADAQAAAYDAAGDNVDVAAFYGLSQLATAPRGDPTMARQQEVGAMLEGLVEGAPQHPGLHHYIIHAYDNPALSAQGVSYAEAYGNITPDVPHALHMPSHIFVRQGAWDAAIDWNERSAEAALAQPLGDVISSHYAHAMDYLIYSHLQKGEVDVAQDLVDTFVGTVNQQNDFGSAYALAATPVRLLLEQDDWAGVAAYPVELHPAIAWEKFPQCVAMTWFARGLGAARSGDLVAAGQALDALKALNEKMEGYWSQLTDAQIGTVAAWVALAEGDAETALALQTEAADLEDMLGKSPVTPGHVLPARELLGDMYGQVGNKEMAEVAWRRTLDLSPERRRSLEAIRTGWRR